MTGRARMFTSQVLTFEPAESKSPAKLRSNLSINPERFRVQGRLLPAVDGLVAEGHLVRFVPLEPFGMAVGEKDVLPIVVRFPSYGRRSIGIAADTILRIVI